MEPDPLHEVGRRRRRWPAGRADRTPSPPPPFAHVDLPIPRDRLLHLGVGATLLFLGLAATLAHGVGLVGVAGTLRQLGWLPVASAVPAALAAFFLALRRTPGRWAYRLHGLAMAWCALLGGSGALFHAAAAGRRGLGPAALFGSDILAPLTFVAVGVAGWIAAWSDEALGVGRVPLAIARGVAPAVPGRRALLILTLLGFGTLGTVTLVDHGAGGWQRIETVPVVAAAWSVAVVTATLFGLGGWRWKVTYVGTMLADVVLGFLGLALHLSSNMAGPPESLLERMVLQAPLSAPLLFALQGLLGLLAVAEPAGDPRVLEEAWPPRRRRGRSAAP